MNEMSNNAVGLLKSAYSQTLFVMFISRFRLLILYMDDSLSFEEVDFLGLYILPCKAKGQYLNTLQVRRHCLLAL